MSARRGLVAGLALVGVLALSGCGDDDTDGANPVGSPPASVSAETGDVDAATILVSGGADSITVVADGDAGTLVSAQVTGEDDGEGLRLVDNGGTDGVSDHLLAVSGGDLTVHLDPGVSWEVGIEAGSDTLDVDLGATTVTHVTLASGASTATLRLPEPTQRVQIDQSGGFGTFDLELAESTGVRWTTSAGSGTVTIDGRTVEVVSASSQFTDPEDLDVQRPFVDLVSSAGIGTFTITRG